MTIQKIGVIGGGSWGTALAQTARRAGREVIIWALEKEVVHAINENHENPLFLPDIPLDPGLKATGDYGDMSEQDAILLVPPAQHMADVVNELADYDISPNIPLVICSKGIDNKRLSLMAPIVKDAFPDNPVAVLSGPSFASETAKDLPTAVNIAIDKRHAQIGEDLVAAMGHKNFRPYLHFDPIGAQIGGSLKNVMAIASGIAQGRNLGENARIALMTRGLAELVRLGEKMGADPMTFMGLSGLGDLTLTCNAMESRNFSLGVRLGKGESLDDIMGSRKSVTEGVHTVKATIELAERHDVRMPIAQSLYNILHGGSDIPSEIDRLLSHPFKHEDLGQTDK